MSTEPLCSPARMPTLPREARGWRSVGIAAQINDRDAPEEDYASQVTSHSAFDLKTAAPANFGAMTLVDD